MQPAEVKFMYCNERETKLRLQLWEPRLVFAAELHQCPHCRTVPCLWQLNQLVEISNDAMFKQHKSCM